MATSGFGWTGSLSSVGGGGGKGSSSTGSSSTRGSGGRGSSSIDDVITFMTTSAKSEVGDVSKGKQK